MSISCIEVRNRLICIVPAQYPNYRQVSKDLLISLLFCAGKIV